MNFNEKIKIVSEAIDHYGPQLQTIVAIEEMSELQKELCKMLRPDPSLWDYEALAEEMADVRLMLFQLQVIHNIPTAELDANEDIKLERLRERMIEERIRK